MSNCIHVRILLKSSVIFAIILTTPSLKKALIALFAPLLFAPNLCAFTPDKLAGAWNGKITMGTISLRIVFHFIQNPDGGYIGEMDSPDQGVAGIGCDNVTLAGDSVFIKITSLNGIFHGVFLNDTTINGVWRQNGVRLPLILDKGDIARLNSSERNIDSNCIETDITLHTPTGDILGTLCIPKNFIRGPVALIIAGSGPTNRNGNSPIGLKTDAYKILAHKLSDNGIASIRYDKRGIAYSRNAAPDESKIRFDDYVNDAIEWINLLKSDNRFTKVTVIGHSEGSLIGMIAARKANVDNFISIAGAGESIDKTLKRQLQNLPPEEKDKAYLMLDSMAAGKTTPNTDPSLNPVFRESVQPYLISWIKYDPAVEIKKLTIPVLIIQGTDDLQVTVQDAEELSAADKHAKLILLDRMNHIFRDVNGDKEANMATYNNPLLPIDSNLVTDICNFIK